MVFEYEQLSYTELSNCALPKIDASFNLDTFLLEAQGKLKANSPDWQKRVKVLETLRSAVIENKSSLTEETLMPLVDCFNIQAKDIRSGLIGEFCKTIQVLAQVMGDQFNPFFEGIFPSLLKLTSNTIKLMSGPAVVALQNVFHFCKPYNCVPFIFRTMKGKSGPQKANAMLSLMILLLNSSAESFEDEYKTQLLENIPEYLRDSDSAARLNARQVLLAAETIWPDDVKSLIESLDATQQKLLTQTRTGEKEEAKESNSREDFRAQMRKMKLEAMRAKKGKDVSVEVVMAKPTPTPSHPSKHLPMTPRSSAPKPFPAKTPKTGYSALSKGSKPAQTPKPSQTGVKATAQTPKPTQNAAKLAQTPKSSQIAAKTPKPPQSVAKTIQTPKPSQTAAKTAQTPKSKGLGQKPSQPARNTPKPIHSLKHTHPVVTKVPAEARANLVPPRSSVIKPTAAAAAATIPSKLPKTPLSKKTEKKPIPTPLKKEKPTAAEKPKKSVDFSVVAEEKEETAPIPATTTTTTAKAVVEEKEGVPAPPAKRRRSAVLVDPNYSPPLTRSRAARLHTPLETPFE